MNSRHLVDPELTALLNLLPSSTSLTAETLAANRARTAAMVASRSIPDDPNLTVGEQYIASSASAPDVRVYHGFQLVPSAWMKQAAACEQLSAMRRALQL